MAKVNKTLRVYMASVADMSAVVYVDLEVEEGTPYGEIEDMALERAIEEAHSGAVSWSFEALHYDDIEADYVEDATQRG